MDTEKALALLRSRLYDPNYVHATFKSSEESNYCKLKFLIMNSISDSCNNSILLLGPRGSGKVAVVDLVLEDLKTQHPDSISVIRLNGLLHSDDNFALKEIARQLCLDHQLLFSKMASSDDNAGFMIDMLKECGLSHKSIIFVLDEFDLFAQEVQCLKKENMSLKIEISLLSQHVSKIELPPNTSAIKDLRILPNGLPLLASLGKKLLLYSMASNNLALKYELPFTNLKYSRVEIDEVWLEWAECMLDYI